MTTASLDLSPLEFKHLFDKGTELVLHQFENLTERKAYHAYPQAEVEAWFDEALPQEGMDSFDLLDEVQKKFRKTSTWNHGPQ